MKNRLQLLAVLLLAGLSTHTLQAQVKGVSYTVSPSIEYSNWGENSGLSDGYSVGGQFGFGFGQFVELRANYLQSINLQRDFSNFDFDNIGNSLLAEQDVTVRRYGGELKLNLAKGGLVPFLTAGAGIQDIERSMMGDSSSNRKNIFFSGGGGLQFSLGDRYTLALQAVNTSFNGSPVRNLIDELEQAEIGVDGVDFENVAISNWSYRASILLYLGGRKPGELTDSDKAYMENFTSGFRGISLPLEVTAGQINFGDGLPYADTKFTGLSSGFNFGPYVGLRAFYLRSMTDGYFSEFNRLSLYGGEGKFKLSNGQGIVPYLNVGGGVIDPLSGFMVDGTLADEADNTPFVSGGLGLDLPISRFFRLSGYAKALLTSNEVASENINPDELSTSMMYGVSADFIIGARSKEAREISKASDKENYDEMVAQSMKEEKGKADKLKKDYQKRIDKLDKEIDKAYEDGDVELMEEKYQERESAQRFINRIAEVEKKEAEANKKASNNKEMNPSEFREMMEELQKSQERSQDRINDRLDDIEQSLNGNSSNRRNRSNNSNMSDREQELQDELDDLKRNMRNDDSDDDSKSRKNSDMTDREQKMQDEIDELKKNARKSGNNAKSEMSDREQELQDQIDELKKNARKSGNDARSDMSDREQELQDEIDKLKRKSRKSGRNTRSDMSDLEQDLQDEIDELKKDSRKNRNDVRSNMDDREQELQDEIDELKKKARKAGNSAKNDIEDAADDVRNSSKGNNLTEKKNNNTEGAAGFRLGNENNRTGNQDEFGEEIEDNSSNFRLASFLTESQLSYKSENLPAKEDSSFFSRFNYDGSSAIGGFNLGGNTTLNIGVRSHYRYRQSNFYVVPEAFFGFGNPASFGLFANAVYQFNLKQQNFAPYVGAGAGVLNIGQSDDGRTKAAVNIVVGSYLFKVGNGRFYVDLSARNFFKYNQLVAGYRLPF